MSRSKRHAPSSTHSANQRSEALGERPGRPHRWFKRGKGWRKTIDHVRLRNAQTGYGGWRTGQKKRDGQKPKEKK